ncbi:hypothetical protein BpHYR1_033214 [Brachionus plicatilis]|uniref:Uncharacterized protein n=1 Tax=Brachionus plicatilis TaxID=10195 RepID=A0A3M7T8F2_BRAPC|nr:hypothetical protein BpHYR1_033214 [Brachionus plicatilis]
MFCASSRVRLVSICWACLLSLGFFSVSAADSFACSDGIQLVVWLALAPFCDCTKMGDCVRVCSGTNFSKCSAERECSGDELDEDVLEEALDERCELGDRADLTDQVDSQLTSIFCSLGLDSTTMRGLTPFLTSSKYLFTSNGGSWPNLYSWSFRLATT